LIDAAASGATTPPTSRAPSRERPLHRPAAARSTTSCCARSSRPSTRRRPGTATKRCTRRRRRVLAEGLVALGLLPAASTTRSRCTTIASSTCTAPATGSAWTSTTSGTTAVRRQSRAARARHGGHRRARLYFDPERETVPFYLREYSEEEMWERRFRLGIGRREEDRGRGEGARRDGGAPDAQRVSAASASASRTYILITADGHEVLTAGTSEDDRGGRARPAPSRLACRG
jgi:hypothetical protein